MLAWKWGPALACGNTVVMKPAEQTPLTALRVGELAIEAGFPAGVINIINGVRRDRRRRAGRTTRTSTRSPSPATSTPPRSSAPGAGERSSESPSSWAARVPNIIFADADLDARSRGASTRSTSTAASAARPGRRLFVQRRTYDEFVEGWPRRPKARLGDARPQDREGPAGLAEQLDKILRYIDLGQAEGAELVAGGTSRDDGFFVEPTIFRNVTTTWRSPATRSSDRSSASPVRVDRRGRTPREQHELRPGRRRLDQGHRQGPQVRPPLSAGDIWINTWTQATLRPRSAASRCPAWAARTAARASTPTLRTRRSG